MYLPSYILVDLEDLKDKPSEHKKHQGFTLSPLAMKQGALVLQFRGLAENN